MKQQRGGKREGAGRKPLPRDKARTETVSSKVEPHLKDFAEAHEGGPSDLIRALLAEAYIKHLIV